VVGNGQATWGMGHGAWGTGHGAWGMGQRSAISALVLRLQIQMDQMDPVMFYALGTLLPSGSKRTLTRWLCHTAVVIERAFWRTLVVKLTRYQNSAKPPPPLL
jgi:hypothetical protein